MADVNRNINETKNWFQKMLKHLLKFMKSSYRFLHIVFTGKEPDTFFKKASNVLNTGVKEISFSAKKKAVALDGPTKELISFDYSNPEDALFIMQSLSQMKSKWSKEGKTVEFMVSALSPTKEISKLRPRQSKKLEILQTELENAKRQLEGIQRELGNSTEKDGPLRKKYEKYQNKVTHLKDTINTKLTAYSIVNGGARIYVNTGQYDIIRNLEQSLNRAKTAKDKEQIKDLSESIAKRVTGEMDFRENFLRETNWSTEGVHGPMDIKELGSSCLVTSITARQAQKLTEIQGAELKPFTIVTTDKGELMLLTPVSAENAQMVSEMLEENIKFDHYVNNRLDEQLYAYGSITFPLEEYKKLQELEQEPELKGVSYSMTYQVVDGKTSVIVGNYTFPDGCKGDKAFEKYSKIVQELKDKKAYEEEVAKDRKRQKEFVHGDKNAVRENDQVENDMGELPERDEEMKGSFLETLKGLSSIGLGKQTLEAIKKNISKIRFLEGSLENEVETTETIITHDDIEF